MALFFVFVGLGNVTRLIVTKRLISMNVTMTWTGVLRGSVAYCFTCNPGVLGSSRTGSSGFFVGVSFGKTLQSPSLVLVKSRNDMNNVSCLRDMSEIMLKAA